MYVVSNSKDLEPQSMTRSAQELRLNSHFYMHINNVWYLQLTFQKHALKINMKYCT